jgi:hypothetical protein
MGYTLTLRDRPQADRGVLADVIAFAGDCAQNGQRFAMVARPMTTRPPSKENNEPVQKAPLGVLFVHGMGSAVQGATLRDHAEPLVEWLANGTDQFGRAELVDVALTPGDDEPAHLTCQLFTLADRHQRDGSTPVSTWVLAESHWAQAFKPASYVRIAAWLIGSVPWMLGEYVHGALRRERTRRTARVLWLRWALVPFYALLGTILAGLIIIVLALLLPAQYVPIKKVARRPASCLERSQRHWETFTSSSRRTLTARRSEHGSCATMNG